MDKFSHKILLHKTMTFKEIRERDFLFPILDTVYKSVVSYVAAPSLSCFLLLVF